MALQLKSNQIGCAVFEPTSQTLFLLEEVQGSQLMDLVPLRTFLPPDYHSRNFLMTHPPCLLVIFQMSPELVLLSSRVDEELEQIVKDTLQNSPTTTLTQDRADGEKGPQIDLRPSSEFSEETAKQKLQALDIFARNDVNQLDQSNGLPIWDTEDSRLLDAVLSVTSPVTIGCAGAVLRYVQRGGIINNQATENFNSSHVVRLVKSFSLDAFLQITPDSMAYVPLRQGVFNILTRHIPPHSALQIFQDDAHPNMHCRSSKEGFSLFGVLNQTVTPQGSTMLHKWVKRPLQDIESIIKRHEGVGYFSRSGNYPLYGELVGCLKVIRNVERTLGNLKRNPSLVDWQIILKVLLIFPGNGKKYKWS